MANKRNATTDPGRPLVYEIRITGHLGHEWTDWFEGLAITLEDNGDTLLTGLSGVVIVVLVIAAIWYFARRRG